MKTFKQFLEERIGTIASVVALGATGAGMYSALQPQEEQPQEEQPQEKQPKVTSKPFSTPTVSFTVQPSPDKGNPPKVLSNNEDDAGQRSKRIRELTLDNIDRHEGFRSDAYPDIKNIPTIGYGSKYRYDEKGNIIGNVEMGDRIEKHKALENVHHHINKEIMPHLIREYPSIFDPRHNEDIHPMYAATMISFAYNMGASAVYDHEDPKRTSVAHPLKRAEDAKDPTERHTHLMDALLGIYDFHKDPKLIHRRHNEVMGVLSAMKSDNHISKDEYEKYSNLARERYNQILRKLGN